MRNQERLKQLPHCFGVSDLVQTGCSVETARVILHRWVVGGKITRLLPGGPYVQRKLSAHIFRDIAKRLPEGSVIGGRTALVLNGWLPPAGQGQLQVLIPASHTEQAPVSEALGFSFFRRQENWLKKMERSGQSLHGLPVLHPVSAAADWVLQGQTEILSWLSGHPERLAAILAEIQRLIARGK